MIAGTGALGLAKEYRLASRLRACNWQDRAIAMGRSITPEFFMKCQAMAAIHEQEAQFWDDEINTFEKAAPDVY